MKTLLRLCLLSACGWSLGALAQPVGPLQPGRPPARPPPSPLAHNPVSPPPAGAGKTIAPAAGASPATVGADHKTCEEIRRGRKFKVYFPDKVDIEKLVQAVADATCKTFIIGDNVRGKIAIVGPETGTGEVTADEFYAAFLAALDANQLTLYPLGKFLKIIDKRSAKQATIPTIIDADEPVTTNEQMVTRLFRIKYVDLEAVKGVLSALVTKDGDAQTTFPPDLIIVNDVGSNIHRLERIIEQIDRKSGSDEIRVLQIRFATAQDMADKITKLFESKNQKPGQRPGPVTMPTPPGVTPPIPAPEQTVISGPATLTQVIPDERTNKLVIIASPAAFERINDIVRSLDVPTVGGGYINVYNLGNANAEDMASTLQALASGTANKQNKPPVAAGAPRGPATAAELFQGEVKVTADKSTNALVIVASQADYRSIVKVIEKLDIPRRQVFVEAVIMEVNIDHTTTFGAGVHYGYELSTNQGTLPVLFATKYTTQGLPPSFSIANLANFGGFLAGLQGPAIPQLAALGLNIPQFGLVLHAMQSSSDVNVLSTPHILTSDNEEAEITVGQNVPFQAGFSPSSLGASVPGLTGATPATGAVAGAVPSLFGGLGSLFAPIQRTNVDLKLTIKPQINDSENIRMVINEQTEEIASRDPVLGPTTAKRSAKTTVVAHDQETVVLGGIMQDRLVESVSKIPILGDIPILGHLFREESHEKIKTNLLLFLTPYIIRDHSDFRRIFERKMRERQQFIEEFYGQVPGYDAAIDFGRKPGPLAKMSQAITKEEKRVENGGPGMSNEKIIRPVDPGGLGLDMRPVPSSTGTSPAPEMAPSPEPLPPSASPPPPPPQPREGPPGERRPESERIQVNPQ